MHYYTIFARLVFKDVWRFRYTFSSICKNLTVLSIRNVVQSVESSIQVLSAVLLNTLRYMYNAPAHNAFLVYIWCKDKRSAFEIRQDLEHQLVSLGTCVCALQQ